MGALCDDCEGASTLVMSMWPALPPFSLAVSAEARAIMPGRRRNQAVDPAASLCLRDRLCGTVCMRCVVSSIEAAMDIQHGGS